MSHPPIPSPLRQLQQPSADSRRSSLAGSLKLPGSLKAADLKFASQTLPAVSGMRTTQEPATEPARRCSMTSLVGSLAELSGGPRSATLTFACRLVLEAQQRAEPVAWSTDPTSSFFPPDAADSGVDLDALAVIRTEKKERAADLLVRSGGFGLVVLDRGRLLDLPLPIQTRLAGLAKRHHTAIVILTEKTRVSPSLGSLVSLRADASRTQKAGDRFLCELNILKDKRYGYGTHSEYSGHLGSGHPGEGAQVEGCRAPAGLR